MIISEGKRVKPKQSFGSHYSSTVEACDERATSFVTNRARLSIGPKHEGSCAGGEEVGISLEDLARISLGEKSYLVSRYSQSYRTGLV